MNFGSHVSIAGGIENAPLNAHKVGADTFQMFSRSPRGGKSNITEKNILEFKKNCQKYNFKNFYIHSPYYINLASANNRIRYGSISVLREELEIGDKLGATAVMTHLGSAKDFSAEKSFDLVVEGIQKILENYKGKTKFLIEISAGSGQIIGDTFEEIGKIIKKIKNKNLGVCFDTCHAFASGYDLRTKKNVEETFKKFDKLIGLKKLVVLHLNDSMVELNSHKDRHNDIGFGLIGTEAFRAIVNHPKLKKLDGIIETPAIKLSDKKTIALLKSFEK
jgi:deoxyribonuclease-4